MSPSLAVNNLVAYSLQVGMLIGLAAFVPAVLRLRLPGAKLAYWHILLIACLLLPLVRPWQRPVVPGTVEFSTSVLAVAPPTQDKGWRPSPAELALLVLAGGALTRLVWLGAGFWRLGQYRRHALPFDVEHPAGMERVSVRISEAVTSPVTFGWRRPVILLPPNFPELAARMRQAILCHEFLHVRRGDWLFTLGEELVRAVLWFHPAIWWLLGEIQLAREQAVDRLVIEETAIRDEYVDALLAIAGARPQLDLAPAPLFLRKRHLKHRVISILKEVRMSKRRLISALAAGLGILAAACWVVSGTFPLSAAPQIIADAPGVSVETGSVKITHRAPVAYPEAALQAGVQGTVVLEVKLDGTGSVSDARVLSGPEELRKAAMQSVLQWHFARESAGTTQQVSIAFVPAALTTATSPSAGAAQMKHTAPIAHATLNPAAMNGTLANITIAGVSDEARKDLLARLPVHEGDTMTSELAMRTVQAVKQYDEHLAATFASAHVPKSGETSPALQLRIAAPATSFNTSGAVAHSSEPPAFSGIRVGGNVQQAKLIAQPRPVYPPEAKAAGLQGLVRFSATISKDGVIRNLETLGGDPLLVAAAAEAVGKWVYEPTLVNGEPVEVITQIDVNFTLSK